MAKALEFDELPEDLAALAVYLRSLGCPVFSLTSHDATESQGFRIVYHGQIRIQRFDKFWALDLNPSVRECALGYTERLAIDPALPDAIEQVEAAVTEWMTDRQRVWGSTRWGTK